MRERAIDVAAVRCDLGWLMVAASDRGVCWVGLGDALEELEAALRRELPTARLAADGARVAPWLGALQDLAAGRTPRRAVPLDVRGSRFQRRVWEAIRHIGAGQTRSYGELARGLGRPGAARAVARACASNRVALAIPCHRVVAADGRPGGYRWGAARKRALLARERAGETRTAGEAAGEKKESDLSLSFEALGSSGHGPARSRAPGPPAAPGP